jgi:hypothetical protein
MSTNIYADLRHSTSHHALARCPPQVSEFEFAVALNPIQAIRTTTIRHAKVLPLSLESSPDIRHKVTRPLDFFDQSYWTEPRVLCKRRNGSSRTAKS